MSNMTVQAALPANTNEDSLSFFLREEGQNVFVHLETKDEIIYKQNFYFKETISLWIFVLFMFLFFLPEYH